MYPNKLKKTLKRNLEPTVSNDEKLIVDIHASVYATPIKHIYPEDLSDAENNQRLHESFYAFAGQVVNHLKFRDKYWW